MVEAGLVVSANLVLRLRPLPVGEHGESSLRNPLMTQGITTDEDSPVNPKVKTSGTRRQGSKTGRGLIEAVVGFGVIASPGWASATRERDRKSTRLNSSHT